MRSPRPSSSSKCSSSSSSSYSLAATSLSSRLLTVFKKAQELTTLCDIEACVIHYGPDGELKTWPEDRDKVRSLALRYIQLDKAKRRKKSINLYEFLNKMKDKKKMINSFRKKAKRNVEELEWSVTLASLKILIPICLQAMLMRTDYFRHLLYHLSSSNLPNETLRFLAIYLIN